MSSNPIASVTYNPVLLAYNSSGQAEETSSANPPSPPSPPPSFPEVTIASVKVVASLELESGEIISITEEEIDKELNKTATLPGTIYLQPKYQALVKLMNAAKEKGSVRKTITFDPAMQIMSLMGIAMANDLGVETFQDIEKRILAISNKNPDKPYLLILFTQHSLANKKISMEKSEALLSQAIKESLDNPDIYYEAYKFYLGANKLDTAYNFLINALQLKIGLNPKTNNSISNWKKDLEEISEKLVPENFAFPLELGPIFILKSEAETKNKNYAQAHEWLEAAEKTFREAIELNSNSSQKNPLLSRLLADVFQKKAQLFLLQKNYSAANKALKASEKTYKKLIEKFPNLAELYFNLANVYLPLLKVSEIESKNKKQDGWEDMSDGVDYGFYLADFESALENAGKFGADDPLLLANIGDTYAAFGKIDKSIEIFKKLVQKDPQNPLFLLKLGDLTLSAGEIEETFKHYEKATKAAEEAKNLDLLAEVHLRFSFLKMQAELELTQLEAGKPTLIQAGLNFLAMALIAYLNPFLLIGNTFGLVINQISNKNYSEEDLQKIISRARSLEADSIDKICRLAQAEKNPMVFYLIAETILAKTQAILKQLEQLEKDLTNPNEIKAYKEIVRGMEQQAESIFNHTLNKGFIQHLEAEFEAARKNGDAPKMLEITQNYFTLYFFLADKSQNKNMNENLKKIIAQKKEAAFKGGIEQLKKILEFTDENKDLQASLGVFQSSGALLENLEKIPSSPSKKDIKAKKEKLAEIMTNSLKAIIKIAKEKKDITTLLELGKSIYTLGPFAQKAFEEAIDLAQNDIAKLFEIGVVIQELWRRKDGENLLMSLQVKEALRQLAVSLYRKMLETAEGENKILACRQLWIFGDHLHAYLGYVGLIDFYRTKNDRKTLGNLFYELGLIAAAQGKTEKGIEWFKRALKEGALFPEQKETVKQELEYLKSGKVPEWFTTKGNSSLSSLQIRSALLLYVAWAVGKPSLQNLEEAAKDLYSANNLSAEVKVVAHDDSWEVEINEQTIDTIVEEPRIWDPVIGGGVGNAEALVHMKVTYNNLFGEGKKIGMDFGWQWFYAKSYKHFNTWNGSLFYMDPSLFVIGENTPVSGGFNLEHQARMNYGNGILEKISGGGVTLGVKIAKGTTLSASPQAYYIQGDGSYYQTSLRISLEKDGRDNRLFPKSGYYLSTAVTPGTNIMHNGTQFFINHENEARYYIPLPFGMTLALRGVIGIGYNLIGGNQYFLGGILNPYIRASQGTILGGPGILASSLEVRAPVIAERIQFYVFGDGGSILGSKSFFYGTGGGMRIYHRYVGLVNIGYGWPGGFFIWFGNLGWN